jgi:DNA-binding GntR family transcriptional regulator
LEAVLTEMRRALLMGDYPSGSRLNVDAISRQLGVSRAPVRDALRVLEGEQQVVYEAHRGYCVPSLNLDELFDLYRVRQMLEAEATWRAVPTLSEDALERIRSAAARVDAALLEGDRVALTYANREFHFLMWTSEQHSYLAKAIERTWNADAYRSHYLADLDLARIELAGHDAILRAAERRDAAEVVRLQDEHRDSELRSLLTVLERQGLVSPSELAAVDAGHDRPWVAISLHNPAHISN